MLHGVSGLMVGLAVFFPLFALGAMGAGDVKLMAAIGAWIGWKAIVLVALYGSLAGGVLALIVALATVATCAHGARVTSRCWLVYWWVEGVKPLPALTLESKHSVRLPYALAIAAGLAVTLWRQRNLKADAAAAASEDGAELIEMAIVLPLLLLLIMGMVDFGFLFQRYVVLTNAAAEGARVASLPGYTDCRCDGARGSVRRQRWHPGRGQYRHGSAVALPGGAGGGTWPGSQVTVTHVYTYQYVGADSGSVRSGRCTAASP